MADIACAEAGADLSRCMDWQEAAAAAEAAGAPMPNLPRGLRVRSAAARRGAAEASDSADGPEAPKPPLMSRRELGALAVFCTAVVLVFGHIVLRRTAAGPFAAEAPQRVQCRQCGQAWWDDFWRWRLHGLASQGGEGSQNQVPPPGMEWEWSSAANDTDWYGVSAELVDSVVAEYADAKLGPILHVGCGDSPMPELLFKAGYRLAEHIDIAPQVVETLRRRYPAAEWPGMTFEVRDFLASPSRGGGPPPPLHRFAAVIDKAGIWDWLQDEAPQHLPRLLATVREALLLEGPEKERGVYIIVTKQTPMQLSETLAVARAEYVVHTSRQLGATGIAWTYVLEPL